MGRWFGHLGNKTLIVGEVRVILEDSYEVERRSAWGSDQLLIRSEWLTVKFGLDLLEAFITDSR